jgi:hypothetical protein
VINIPPTPARIFRKRKQVAAKAPPAALTLVAASIDDDVTVVTMQFDRAIDVSSMVVTEIQVGTDATGNLYQGTDGPTLLDPQTVRVNLAVIDTYPETNEKLFASDATGIVAVDDGQTWEGTSGTGLPFP